MTAADHQRRGLVADLTRRLALATYDEMRVVDRVLTRLEQLRFIWSRRIATGPHDVDTRWHLAGRSTLGSFVTRCEGRWSVSDVVEHIHVPDVADRCMACQRAAWSGTEIDPLIAAVFELLAADDRDRAQLRAEVAAEQQGLCDRCGDELDEVPR